MAHLTEEILQAFVAGNLNAQTEAEIMEHIACCDSCAEHFADLLAEESLITPPPDLKKEVLEQTLYRKSSVQTIQKVSEKAREKQRRFWIYSAKVGFAMAASLLMIIGMSADFPKKAEPAAIEESAYVEKKDSYQRKNPVSGSLQKVSGKMGDALSDFLAVVTRAEKEERD